ncbi:bifunctional (p)ppGpp synthetase/guanosine-3',5'-bis(diphosphate) 3'-pyrophosphohydrolase [Candidatus Uhrbacteria bacterium]|nr:bifunctional (p)ppGpp synthetase/guanosine-3',5'-bis(diphosphate) 3'-pyrophosphohydrolase [Candidatus Uhrbacteria bacterium]
MLRDVKKLLKENHPNANLETVERAYEFAKEAHAGQFRTSGGPHIDHAMGTGKLLASWRMPDHIVVAGILHDITEDTPYTLKDLETRFGRDVADIVEGETKISALKYRGRERYAENLRKMFLAIAQDVRVVIVKCADRIDNLKTLNFFPENKQKRIAFETMEIYAPIASRLGMGLIRGELEDLSFKYIYPEEYEWALGLLVERVPKKEEYLDHLKGIIADDLKKNQVNPISIHGRVKHLYSLYKKLLKRDRDIEKIYDLVALRLIVPAVQDCYTVLGVIHQRWTPLKGRIKDYIAQPKPNGYQSLHTTVFCEDGEIVEFQIRTQEMHEEAEFGIAAHWFYAERGKTSENAQKINHHLKWLKELVEIQKNIQDHTNFLKALESLKIDFFRDRIFVFTPKGDVIDLPEGATPIDYAYAIHTEVGNHCSGATINEQAVSLKTTLQSGDVVEITTDKNRKGPAADWLELVKTAHARSKIKENLKKTRLAGWARIRDLARKH